MSFFIYLTRFIFLTVNLYLGWPSSPLSDEPYYKKKKFISVFELGLKIYTHIYMAYGRFEDDDEQAPLLVRMPQLSKYLRDFKPNINNSFYQLSKKQ